MLSNPNKYFFQVKKCAPAALMNYKPLKSRLTPFAGFFLPHRHWTPTTIWSNINGYLARTLKKRLLEFRPQRLMSSPSCFHLLLISFRQKAQTCNRLNSKLKNWRSPLLMNCNFSTLPHRRRVSSTPAERYMSRSHDPNFLTAAFPQVKQPGLRVLLNRYTSRS